jgi:hypothetical protein
LHNGAGKLRRSGCCAKARRVKSFVDLLRPFAHLTRTIDREEKHLAKRIAAAILLCAVMVMIAAAPLATADTHHIVKGAQGPRASSVTWEYVPAEHGIWHGAIDNHGLRWIVIDVYDNTTGAMERVGHQHLRFAAFGAYPSGAVDSMKVVMSPSHKYVIVAIPNGPQTSFCYLEDVLVPAVPPTAQIDLILPQVGLTVNVDGSRSYDAPPGMIMSYAWDFGDGTAATGVSATHTYGQNGQYDINLTVTDDDGLTGSAGLWVDVKDYPPSAFFTASVDGLTVSVDAHLSTDDVGIDSYVWSWGDATADGSGVTASHTYTAPVSAPGSRSIVSAPIIAAAGPPVTPYLLYGYTTNALGNPYECYVTITNLRTGEVVTTDSFKDPLWPLDGYYEYDLANNLLLGYLAGDQMKVDAVSVSGTMGGSVTVAVPSSGGSMPVNGPILASIGPPPHLDVTITLTVTDTKGQTSTATMPLTLYP